jgi:Winged helix-turn helix
VDPVRASGVPAPSGASLDHGCARLIPRRSPHTWPLYELLCPPAQAEPQLTDALPVTAQSGWDEDQRWTLARVATLIGRMFQVSYSLKGVALLLHRMGWTPQVPVHRAAERDDDAVATWRKSTWPQVKGSRAGWVRGSASPTKPDTR